jgi:hypothetical protein
MRRDMHVGINIPKSRGVIVTYVALAAVGG